MSTQTPPAPGPIPQHRHQDGLQGGRVVPRPAPPAQLSPHLPLGLCCTSAPPQLSTGQAGSQVAEGSSALCLTLRVLGRTRPTRMSTDLFLKSLIHTLLPNTHRRTAGSLNKLHPQPCQGHVRVAGRVTASCHGGHPPTLPAAGSQRGPDTAATSCATSSGISPLASFLREPAWPSQVPDLGRAGSVCRGSSVHTAPSIHTVPHGASGTTQALIRQLLVPPFTPTSQLPSVQPGPGAHPRLRAAAPSSLHPNWPGQ